MKARDTWRHPGSLAALGLAASVVVLVGALLLLTPSAAGPVESRAPTTLSPGGMTPASTPTPSNAAGPVVGPEVQEFGLTDAEHGWVMSTGRLYVTADAGATWTFGLDLGDRSPAPLVEFVDGLHGWVVPINYPIPYDQPGPAIVQRTADGGRSWQQATIPSVAGVASGLSFFDSARGLLAFEVGGGKPGSLWSTSDGGVTWSRVAMLPVAIVGSVTFGDAKTGWALAATEPNPAAGHPSANEIYVTRDGGASWTRSILPVPPTGWTADTWHPQLSRMPSVLGPDRAVISAWYGNGTGGATQLLVTTDAGASWSVAATIPSLGPVPIDVIDADRWVAAIPDQTDNGAGKLQITDDGGKTWHPIGDVPAVNLNYLGLAFADRLHGWAWNNGGSAPLQLYATEDGGANWRLMIPSGGPVRTPVPCSADSIMLGPDSSVPTPWFNVFNMNFDPNSPVTITFDKPVIGWPGSVEPARPITVFDVPAASRGGGKFSFRPADPGVVTVVMRIDGGGCSATTTVYLSSTAGSSAP